MKPLLQLMSQQQQAKYPVKGKDHGYCQLNFQLTAFVFVLWVVFSLCIPILTFYFSRVVIISQTIWDQPTVILTLKLLE